MMVFLIATLLVFTQAEWKKLVEIVGAGVHIKHYSSYMEPTDLVTHIAFCAEQTTDDGITTQYLGYARVSEDNEIINTIEISRAHGCRSVSISGESSYRELIIAMEGQRRFHLGVCNSTNPDGCYDIYTTHSYISGEKWSPLEPIHRQSPIDDTDRTKPTIIVNRFSRRAYVFYLSRPIKNTDPKLAYVTRPPSSMIFGTETIIPVKPGFKLITVLPTYVDTKLTVHLFVEDGEQTKRVFSANMIKWEEAKVPGDNYFTSFISNPLVAGQTIVGVSTDTKETAIIVSENNGETWTDPSKIMDRYHRISVGTIMKGDQTKVLLMTTSFMQKNQTLYSFPIDIKEPKKEEAPFENIDNYGVFKPTIYSYISTKLTAKALAYIWAKPDKPRLYAAIKDDF